MGCKSQLLLLRPIDSDNVTIALGNLLFPWVKNKRTK